MASLKQQMSSFTANHNVSVNAIISQQKGPLVYGYADRAGHGPQKYKYNGNGYGEAILFPNVSNNGCCNVGNMLNPKNGRFTAHITGIYSFTVSAWVNPANGKSAQLWFHLNGKRQQTFSAPINNSDHCAIFSGTLTTHIAKNDYIDFRMYQGEFKGTTKDLMENFFHTFVRWTLIKPL